MLKLHEEIVARTYNQDLMQRKIVNKDIIFPMFS